MKYINYIKYFFFIAFNWNIKLAFFTIRHEIKGERKYGVDTTGVANLKGDTITDDILEHSENYQGANYYLLEKIFDFLKNENENSNLVDFGSGRGRILAVAAYYGFRKIIGIEISNVFARESRINIQKIKNDFPDAEISVIEQDAIDFKITPDQKVFFFFNPFDEITLLKVVKNILASLRSHDREIFICYINPVHKEVFLSAGFIEVFYLEKFQYIECSILMHTPEI